MPLGHGIDRKLKKYEIVLDWEEQTGRVATFIMADDTEVLHLTMARLPSGLSSTTEDGETGTIEVTDENTLGEVMEVSAAE
jgi:hypothetical protein